MERAWSCHRSGQYNGHVTEMTSLMEGESSEVVTLMEGEWSCCRGGQFNGERMVMLQWWPV